MEDADKTIKNATIPGVKFFEVYKACKELATDKLDVESDKDVKQLSVFHHSSRTFVMIQQLKLQFISLHCLALTPMLFVLLLVRNHLLYITATFVE